MYSIINFDTLQCIRYITDFLKVTINIFYTHTNICSICHKKKCFNIILEYKIIFVEYKIIIFSKIILYTYITNIQKDCVFF